VTSENPDPLQAAETRFGALVRALDAYVWETGPDLRFTYFSPQAAQILPVDTARLIGARPLDSCPEDDDVARHREDLAAHRPFRHFTLRVAYPSGEARHLRLNGEPRFAADGAFLGYVGTGQDVTLEVEARFSESKLRDAIEVSSAVFVVFDSDDRLVMFNVRFRRFYFDLTGVEPALGTSFEVLCKRASDNFPMEPEERERWHADRLKHHRRAASSIEVRLPQNRWALIDDRQTADGGAMVLITDITEMKAREAQLLAMRDAAMRADQAKTRFLATMSHELRTPLNAILGFSEVMKNEVFGAHAAPAYREYATDIHDSGMHLLNLINEILDLSRIEAGRYDLSEEAVQLAHTVEECRHMMTLRARSKGQTFASLIDDSLPRLWADERALRQIVLNLLSNAVKFTPPGGEITIKVGWTSSGGQYVSVKDSGPGIPEDELGTVMSSFGRGSLAIKTAEQGSGLGLPIVKGLIDLHGGGFQLKSKPREGTEVIVTFPASRGMDALAAVNLGDGTAAAEASPSRRARAA
jgi:PAS domain S-box-containing protein